jgi:hypothetical protein
MLGSGTRFDPGRKLVGAWPGISVGSTFSLGNGVLMFGADVGTTGAVAGSVAG